METFIIIKGKVYIQHFRLLNDVLAMKKRGKAKMYVTVVNGDVVSIAKEMAVGIGNQKQISKLYV